MSRIKCTATVDEKDNGLRVAHLEPDVESFEFSVVAIQRDDFEQPVVQSETNHTTLRINNSNDSRL